MVFVVVIVKFPLALKTLVTTGVYWFNGSARLVLISTQYVQPDRPLVPLSTNSVPNKLILAMPGGAGNTLAKCFHIGGGVAGCAVRLKSAYKTAALVRRLKAPAAVEPDEVIGLSSWDSELLRNTSTPHGERSR